MKGFLPNSYEEFIDKYNANVRYIGEGEDKCQIFPCPFCGEPDWLFCYLAFSEEFLTAGATCEVCGRTAHALFFENGVFHFVQTAGPKQLKWMDVRKAS